MLDIKYVREHPAEVERACIAKHSDVDVAKLTELDGKRRSVIQETETLKHKRNVVSEEIAFLKKNKENADQMIADMRLVSDTIKQHDEELRLVEAEMESMLLHIPNVTHESVPAGRSAADNVEVRAWATPKQFEWRKDHLTFATEKGILDFERGAKVAGSGFGFYVGKGATLERSLINFFITENMKRGYTEMFPPFVVNSASLRGTGQLPKFEDDVYSIPKDDLYLIPTAEVPITNFYRDEILPESQIPTAFCGYSACFRREAGSYGKDNRGFLRVHQFNKVELVRFEKPESSLDALESLVGDVEHLLKLLELPYRVLLLCDGDTGFASTKTYDLEVWSPCEQKWLEVSSCSNFSDYQARRSNIRYRPTGGKPEFVHTLNGSGIATSRIMVAVLENWQQEDGSIKIPDVLVPFTGFDTI